MNIAGMMFSQRIVNALGWTLFHSLWQGALAALGFALILYFTRAYSARARYWLGLITLALILIMSGVTFWNHYSAPGAPQPESIAVRPAPQANADSMGRIQTPPQAKPGRSWSAKVAAFFKDYFDRHLPLIVTLWLLGVLFLTLRFAGGFLYAQRLKHHQSRSLPRQWQERMGELGRRLGVRRPLQLLESLRVKTPVVIGHLKPVILLPVGLATGLAPDEVEALLAHELAHVARRDYLLNILQSLADILYFFHPGIRWISASVRQEREHCCDDLAVTLCGSSQSAAKALAHLQVGGIPATSLAAAGRVHGLFQRIKRLLNPPQLVHDFREGFVSALILVFCLFGTLKMIGAAGSGGAPATTAKQAGMSRQAASEQSPPASRFALVSFVLNSNGVVRLIGEGAPGSGDSGVSWIVDEGDGQVIWYMDLSSRTRKNGKTSFAEDVNLESGAFSWYRPSGWKVTAQWKRADGKGAWEPLTMFVGSEGRTTRKRNIDEEPLKIEETRLREEAELLRLETEAMRDLERQAREEEARLREEEERQRSEEEATRAVAERDQRELDMRLRAEEAERMAREGEQLRLEEARLQAEEARLKIEEMNFKKFIDELVREGLISEKAGYRVKLSASGLLINHRKQPQAVFEKYKKLYESLTGKKMEGKHYVEWVNEVD